MPYRHAVVLPYHGGKMMGVLKDLQGDVGSMRVAARSIVARFIAARFIFAATLAVWAFGGPLPARAGDSTLLTTLGGAALGGFIGNQFGHGSGRVAATSLGVVTGAIVGNSVGESLSRGPTYYGTSYYSGYYSPYGYNAPYYAYEPNYVAPPSPPPPRVIYVEPEAVEYREREPAYVQGGYVGESSAASEGYCREYTQQVRMNGRVEEIYGTACLQPDGSWRIER